MLLAACGTPSSGDSVGPLGRARRAVAFGDLDSGHPTVGLVGNGGGSCTGTLIGRRTVLTAGHCVSESGAAPSFTLTSAGNERYEGKSAVAHPQINLDVPNFSDYDLAIVRLERPVSGVKPSQLTWTAPQSGMTVTLVGFGIPGDSGLPGAKRTGLARVAQVTPLVFYHAREPARPTTCSGDSGGPIFYDEGGEERLMGVHSGGTVPCDGGAGYGVHVRVDSHRAFIEKEAQGDLYTGGPIDVVPPTVSIVSPAASARPEPSFALEVEAKDDDSGVARVELWIEGKRQGELSAPPYRFDVSGLERRCHDIEVRAIDAEENVGRAERQICVSDGDPFGTQCSAGESCASGLCLAGTCSQLCTSLKLCPDGYDCQKGQCVALDGGGAGGCAAAGAHSGAGGPGTRLLPQLSLALLLLLGAAALRSALRRRRQR